MFQALRPNSQIFILYKGEKLSLETGFITSVSIPRPKFEQQIVYNKPQSMVVDIVVKVGNQSFNYNNIDASADIAESFNNNENIVIATSKEAMNSEISNLRQKSLDIINSVDLHKNLINDYDTILQRLNPEIAEKEQQKTEIKLLKEQMSMMSKNMEDLMLANRSLLEQLSKKGN